MLFPIQTEDGSYTLSDQERHITYRSTQGALMESRHVFLKGSALEIQPTPWQVLELGFGTGLNFLVTATALLKTEGKLIYHAFEPEPISLKIWQQLAYQKYFPEEPLQVLASALEQVADSKVSVYVESDRLQLSIYPNIWQDIKLPDMVFQAIYHDPFGPHDAPDCWTEACFRFLRKHLAPEGRLATYSAAGHVRRAMKTAGLHPQALPGAGRKREMTIATT